MNDLARDLLRQIYYSSERNTVIRIDELETLTGRTSEEIRPVLEDLKSQSFIHENEYLYEMSSMGRDYVRSREA